MLTLKQSAMATESLSRARSGQSIKNDLAVVEACNALGLEGIPRVNMLTYHAWRAKSRQVRKGEHAVCSVTTWIPINGRDSTDEDGEPIKGAKRLRPKTAHVFHVSQTEPIAA